MRMSRLIRGPSLAAGAAGRWNGRRMVVVSLRKRQAQGQSIFFIIFAPRRGEKIVVNGDEVKNGRQNIHLQKRRLRACRLLKLRQLRIHSLSISRDAGIVIRIDADDQPSHWAAACSREFRWPPCSRSNTPLVKPMTRPCARQARTLSSKEVATRFGVSKATLHRWPASGHAGVPERY